MANSHILSDCILLSWWKKYGKTASFRHYVCIKKGMKGSFLYLLLALSCCVYAADEIVPKYEFTIEGKGSIGFERKFVAQGSSTLYDADSILRPYGGYNVLYQRFISTHRPSDSLWQDALRFQNYLEQDYGVVAPAETLAMQMGVQKIFQSTSDAEIPGILQNIGYRLSFEQKITMGSMIGNLLLEGYDYERMNGSQNGPAIVTFRDMIDARKNGKSAGVCRDMTVAITQTLKEMGVNNAFTIAYQSTRSRHATVLVQDPNNAAKTYTINYYDVTSNEAATSSTHLLQDSTVPDTTITYEVYDRDGKILTTLPSGLGEILKEMTGGDVEDLDPMAVSKNQVLTAVLARKRGFDIGAGIGRTQNGDEVMALTAGYTLNSDRAPGRYAIAFYSNERDSRIGPLEQSGVYLTADQRIRSRPLIIRTRGGGEVSTRIVGRFRTNVQIQSYKDNGAGSTENYTLWNSSETYSAGSEVRYQSGSGKTRAQVDLYANTGWGKSDMRNERDNNYGLYMKDFTVNALVGHELASGLDGFVRATLTIRQEELGSQARTEGGLRYRWNDNEVSLVVGREGSVTGPRLAFIPGSLEQYYGELSATFKKRFRTSAGVYCSTATQECALKAQGAFVLPLNVGRR